MIVPASHNTAAAVVAEAVDALHNTAAAAVAIAAASTKKTPSSPSNEEQSHEYTN